MKIHPITLKYENSAEEEEYWQNNVNYIFETYKNSIRYGLIFRIILLIILIIFYWPKSIYIIVILAALTGLELIIIIIIIQYKNLSNIAAAFQASFLTIICFETLLFIFNEISADENIFVRGVYFGMLVTYMISRVTYLKIDGIIAFLCMFIILIYICIRLNVPGGKGYNYLLAILAIYAICSGI